MNDQGNAAADVTTGGGFERAGDNGGNGGSGAPNVGSFNLTEAFTLGAKPAFVPNDALQGGAGEANSGQAGQGEGSGTAGAAAAAATGLPEGITPEVVALAQKYNQTLTRLEGMGLADDEAVTAQLTQVEQQQSQAQIQGELRRTLTEAHNRIHASLQAEVDAGNISPDMAERLYHAEMRQEEQQALGAIQQRQADATAAQQRTLTEVRNLVAQHPALVKAGDSGIEAVMRRAAAGIPVAQAVALEARHIEQIRQMAVADHIANQQKQGQVPPTMGAGGQPANQQQGQQQQQGRVDFRRASFADLIPWMKPQG